MQQITIKGTSVTYYSPTSSDSHHHHVRRTQAHLLRAPAVASVIWPGEYLEMSIPKELEPDISLALQPHPDNQTQQELASFSYSRLSCAWHPLLF